MFSNLRLTVSEDLLPLSVQESPIRSFVSEFRDLARDLRHGKQRVSLFYHDSLTTTTGRQAFSFRVIGSSSARIEERLTDGDIVVVEIFGEPLLCHGLLGELDMGLCDKVVEEFLSSWGPRSSAAVRVVLVHDIKEEEGEKQKEVQEAKGDGEKEREVGGEVGERVTQRAHETWR